MPAKVAWASEMPENPQALYVISKQHTAFTTPCTTILNALQSVTSDSSVVTDRLKPMSISSSKTVELGGGLTSAHQCMAEVASGRHAANTHGKQVGPESSSHNLYILAWFRVQVVTVRAKGLDRDIS